MKKQNQLAVNEKLENKIEEIKGKFSLLLIGRNTFGANNIAAMWDDAIRTQLSDLDEDFSKAIVKYRDFYAYLERRNGMGQLKKPFRHWHFEDEFGLWITEQDKQQNAKSEKINPIDCGDCFGSGMKTIYKNDIPGSIRCDHTGKKLDVVYEERDIKSFVKAAEKVIVQRIPDPVDGINAQITRLNKEFILTDHSEREKLDKISKAMRELEKKKKALTGNL